MLLVLLRALHGAAPAESVPVRDELWELGKQSEQGNPRATRELLTALVPHLLRAVRRVLGPSHPFAEDVAHDAAYTVLDRLCEFRGEGTLLNYARRVAMLTALNMRRRDAAQKRARDRDAIDPDAIASERRDPEEQLATQSFLPAVRELLDTLPEQLAETFALQVVLGYSLEEIATTCNVPLETARSRLRLAKRALRERALAHPVLCQAAELSHDR
jgi:RNA polymerase sigma factor (sigma-70 family)